MISFVESLGGVGLGPFGPEDYGLDGRGNETIGLPEDGRFVSVGGVGLHYLERGQGRPLVFLHGAGLIANEFMLSPLASMLADRYRLICFDRPGYGFSGRGQGLAGPAAQARLIHSALARIGIERPILLGHSWSGALVLNYGLTFPDDVSGLVSIAGWSFAAHQTAMKLTSVVSRAAVDILIGSGFASRIGPRMATKAMERVFNPAPVPETFKAPPFLELLMRQGQLHANAEDIKALNPDVLAVQRRYRRLLPPLEILTGSADRIVEPERHGLRLAKIVAGSTVTHLQGAGHMIHHTDPDAVLAAVDRLARL